MSIINRMIGLCNEIQTATPSRSRELAATLYKLALLHRQANQRNLIDADELLKRLEAKNDSSGYFVPNFEKGIQAAIRIVNEMIAEGSNDERKRGD